MIDLEVGDVYYRVYDKLNHFHRKKRFVSLMVRNGFAMSHLE